MGTDLRVILTKSPVPSGEFARVRDIGDIRAKQQPCRCTFNCNTTRYQAAAALPSALPAIGDEIAYSQLPTESL